MTDTLLTVRQVAQRLGVSQRSVWKMLASGRIPQAARLGRSRRWRESDIATFIRTGCDMGQFEAERTAERAMTGCEGQETNRRDYAG